MSNFVFNMWPKTNPFCFRLSCLIWMIGLSGLVRAQTAANFEWSPWLRFHKFASAEYTFQHKNGYGVVLRHNNQIKVVFTDTSLNIKGKTALKLNKNKEHFLETWFSGNHLWILSSRKSGNHQLALQVYRISPDSLNQITGTQTLSAIDLNRLSTNIKIRVLHRGQRHFIWHENPVISDQAHESITVLTYNDSLKLTDRAVVELKTRFDLCDVYRIEPLDSGRFLIFTKDYRIRPVDQRGFETNYRLGYHLAVPDRQTVTSAWFFHGNILPEKGRAKFFTPVLEVAGMYTEKTDGPTVGYFDFRFDFASGRVLSDTFHPFPSLVRQLPTNGYPRSVFKSSGFYFFSTDFLIKTDEKERLLLAEQCFLIPATVGSSYTYNYLYGDLLFLYLDSGRQVQSALRLKKNQQVFNHTGELSSYYIDRDDQGLFLLFNDHAGNRQDAKTRELVWYRQSVLKMARPGETGFDFNSLASYQDMKGILQIRDVTMIKPGTFLVFARRKNTGRLGIMTLSNLPSNSKP